MFASHLRAAYDQALGEVDILAMPTTPMKSQRYQPSLGIVDRVLGGLVHAGKHGRVQHDRASFTEPSLRHVGTVCRSA